MTLREYRLLPLLFVLVGCVEPLDEWETNLSYDVYYLEYSECRKLNGGNYCEENVDRSHYWYRVGVRARFLELNTNDVTMPVFMECSDNPLGPDLNTPFRWYDARDKSEGRIDPSLYIKEKYNQKECWTLKTAIDFDMELKKLKEIYFSK